MKKEIIYLNSTLYDFTSFVVDTVESSEKVLMGGIQIAGGIGEMLFGMSLMGLPEPTLLSIGLGSYIVIDGFSNVMGGVSKMSNAIQGNGRGDDANFMKLMYEQELGDKGVVLYYGLETLISLCSFRFSLTNPNEAIVFPKNEYSNVMYTGLDVYGTISGAYDGLNEAFDYKNYRSTSIVYGYPLIP